MLTPDQFMQLSQNFTPSPILAALSQGGGITDTSQLNYSAMLQPSGGDAGPTQPAGAAQAAPLDPRSLAMLNSMMPQPGKPQFIGGAHTNAKQVNVAAPDVSQLMNVNLSKGKTTPQPTLGQLIGR